MFYRNSYEQPQTFYYTTTYLKHLQHLVCCHVNEVCRLRYITQLYSLIGDANAVKETDFKFKTTHVVKQGLIEPQHFQNIWENGGNKNVFCYVCVCMSVYCVFVRMFV